MKTSKFFVCSFLFCLATVLLVAPECGARVRKSKFKPFVIENLEPAPDFWKVRPAQIEEVCKSVVKGHSEVIARTPLGYPVYAVYYGDFSEDAPQSNWSAGNSSNTVDSYLGTQRHAQTVMLIAGVHGAEAESVAAAINLIRMLETGSDFKGDSDPELLSLIEKYRLIIVPCANMDGRSICPDHLRGVPYEQFRAVSQGLWADGSLVGWRGSKEYFPLPMDKVSFPGGYPNSQGFNIQHDATPGDVRTAEARALLKLAARWRVDFVLNSHSCEYQSFMLAPSFVDTPEHIEYGMALSTACNQALYEAGLRRFPRPCKEASRTLNINNLFNMASGALALTLECTVSWDDVKKQNVLYTFEQLMAPPLVCLKTILACGMQKPFNSRGNAGFEKAL